MALVVYVFDDKYAADTDGFTFNLSAWVGQLDTLTSATATIDPAGATIESVAIQGSVITVWVSGGAAGTTYTIEIEAKTAGGRDCRIRGTFQVDA